MGYMNWIYQMITDGSYIDFKELYEYSKDNNIEKFMWDTQEIRTDFASHICIFVDRHLMPEYTQYLEDMIEEQAEWEAEIQMGK